MLYGKEQKGDYHLPNHNRSYPPLSFYLVYRKYTIDNSHTSIV